MAKNTMTYWNVLNKSNENKWEVIEGSNGQLEQLSLTIDEINDDYTRLTRFREGADT